ncbi:MAG: hypothetical protein CME63_15400 [Halobacteriovoraceae bacterium]|nr:hypothetical protein [Halobacteriovoraceae bacterium]MBC99126.1 hypothetical protein [Halobacteriovoraceae bacterium]|tara:strand:+ start:192499 stop:192747 length:249 start_codon:yes stop_codon:yes gene_type:complete
MNNYKEEVAFKAITEPSVVFSKPRDVVICSYLSTDQKKVALENWKATLKHMSKSTSEGMQSSINEDIVLGKVVDALREVENI